ncbi:MAG: transporter substrate-binding domain-containing protein [Gammaproteobacteria bacterium]|nr:transporter substrate-binding domain-containing protein [Gammaproteobacteria bacterium]
MTALIKKILFSFLFLLTLSSHNVLANDKIYTLSYSPGSLYHALVRDRMEVVYQRAGLKAKFISIPHKRSVASANEGVVDGDVGRNPVIEKKFKNLRRVNVAVSESLGSVYTIKDSIRTYDSDMLKKYNVGYVHGVRWVKKKMEGIKATTVKTYPQLVKMLLEGRIDIAIGTDISMDAAIKKVANEEDKIRKLTPKANRSPTYHFVHKKNSHIIPALEKALKELKAENYWRS